MVNHDRMYEQSVRNVFIINPTQKIRAILTYPATNGRNMYELLRLIYALQLSTQYDVVTPANWMPSNPVIVPITQTFEGMLERMENQESLGLKCARWFMCYKSYDEVVKQSNTVSG